MKAPKCYRCGGRHWSTQPCPASNRMEMQGDWEPIDDAHREAFGRPKRNTVTGAINTRPAINKERLTDAINRSPPAINTSPSPPDPVERRQGRDVVGGEKVDGGVSMRLRAASGDSPEPKTPNRRNRADYNTYMRDYMARRRQVQ